MPFKPPVVTEMDLLRAQDRVRIDAAQGALGR
jgi:hypothetical protein